MITFECQNLTFAVARNYHCFKKAMLNSSSSLLYVFFATFPFRFRTGIFLAVDWFSIVCWSYYVFHIYWQFSDVPLNQVWPICWSSWVFGCFHGGNVGYTTILPKLSEQIYPWHEVSNNMHTVSKLQKFTFNLQIVPFLQMLRENNVHDVDCH